MSRSVRNILRNSALQTLNIYATTACNFLLILVYTRILGPEHFGALVTSQAQVLVWIMLVDLGLYGGLVSALATAEAEKQKLSRQGFRAWDLVWRVLGVRLLGACLGFAAIVLLAYSHAKESGGRDQERFWQDLAFSPYLFALAIQQTLTAYVNFRGRFLIGIVGNILGVAGSAALAIFLAWRGDSLTHLLLAQSWGGFLAAAIIIVCLWIRPTHPEPTRRLQRKRSGDWNQTAWRALFKDAWPYALIFTASVLWQRLDQLTASHFLGLEAGGQYALAVRLMAIPMMLANAIYIAITPDLQRLGRHAPEKLAIYVGTVGKSVFRFGLPLAASLLALIFWLMIPLFPKFEAARNILFWFVPGIWAYWLQNFFMAALYGLRSFKEVVLVHLYSLCLYAGALLVLVQGFGLLGVVLSYDLFCLSLAYFALRALRRSGAVQDNFSLFGPLSLSEREFLQVIGRRIFLRAS